MKTAKRLLALTLALLFLLPAFAACRKDDEKKEKTASFKGYETAEDCAIDAIRNYYNGDWQKIIDAMPQEAVKKYKKDHGMDDETFNELIANASQAVKDENYKYLSVDFRHETVYSSEEIAEIEEDYGIKIEEAKSPDYTVKYTHNGRQDDEGMEVPCAKINGRWYVSPDLLPEFMDVVYSIAAHSGKTAGTAEADELVRSFMRLIIARDGSFIDYFYPPVIEAYAQMLDMSVAEAKAYLRDMVFDMEITDYEIDEEEPLSVGEIRQALEDFYEIYADGVEEGKEFEIKLTADGSDEMMLLVAKIDGEWYVIEFGFLKQSSAEAQAEEPDNADKPGDDGDW